MEKRKLLMLDAAHRAMSTIEPPRPGARCTRAALGAGRPRYGVSARATSQTPTSALVHEGPGVGVGMGGISLRNAPR